MQRIVYIFKEKEDIDLEEFLEEDLKDVEDYFDGEISGDEIEIAFTITDTKLIRILTNKKEYKKLIGKLEKDLTIVKSFGINKDCGIVDATIKEMKKLDCKEFLDGFEYLKIATDADNESINLIKKIVSKFEDKKIIIPGTYSMDRDSFNNCMDFIQKLKGIVPSENIYLNVSKNIAPVSVENYKEAYKIIQNIVSLVKSLNMSPLEEIMFVYDIIKKREYKHEDENQDKLLSRDLVKVLLGDEIVCAGFNAIFEMILTILGHQVTSITLNLTNGEGKHIRSAVYVDDPKYFINGLYSFDVTWDSKKQTDKCSYNKYKYFLKTFDVMQKYDRIQGVYIKEDEYLYPNTIYNAFKSLPDTFTELEFMQFGGKRRFNRFLQMMGRSFFEIKSKDNKKSELIKVYKDIYDAFNQEIPDESFARLVYNVRKIEYYLNPLETPFSIDDLNDSVSSNLFDKNSFSSTDIAFIRNILKLDESVIIEKEKQKLFSKVLGEDVKKEIESIKITRALRSYTLKK